MKSIHRRLQLLMLIEMLTTSLIVGVLVVFQASDELNELYDAHLKQIATLVSAMPRQAGIERFLGESFVSKSDVAKWEEEDYLIQVWDKYDRLVYSQPQIENFSALPLQEKRGRNEVLSEGMRWNLYRVDGDRYNVQVAQPAQPRTWTIRDTSLFLVIPLLLQIPAFIFIASITARKGLAPIAALSQALRGRHQWSLDALPTNNLPEELIPLAQALNQLLTQLQAVLDQQRNLLSDAAHELRTPLTALRLQLDAYRRAENDDEKSECLSALDRGIDRSSAMVRQLLLFARSEVRTLHLPVSDITLEQIASAAFERHLPIARAKGIDLGIARLSNARVSIVKSDIEVVIDNLISNAINYSPEGSRVDVSLEADSDVITIDVLDEGKGIPSNERERIFDRFYRISNFDNHGSGLGLAIVRAICERNNAVATIHDTSTGVGTLFRIVWPRSR